MLCRSVAISFIIIHLLVVWINAYEICFKKCICHKTSLHCRGFTFEDLESDDFQNSITTDHEKISITDGHITELPKNIFGSCIGDSYYILHKLKYLDLRRNSIKGIYARTFHCMPNLQILNLAENQWIISPAQTHVFTSLPSLRILNLTNAFYDGIKGHIHSKHLNLIFLENDLRKLEVLTLDSNGFTVFDEDAATALCTFPALKMLKLSNNLLPKIVFRHVGCLSHLEYLDLSYNNIITFEDYGRNGLLYGLDFIQSVSPNMTVNFVGNEFDCDCELLEFHNWLKRTKVHVIHRTKLTCHDGLLFNKAIISVPTDQFKCVFVKQKHPQMT